ncbi:HutD/Ves family protein [Clostridium estertheticum]|uniref:HutD/Ves family protein n=1 Tax=Clostridium estertheticum TaxID=238834 RepID=UPI001C7D173B|nr:HutD family protein [Clostridium estertheticum]MBX4263045.1 HutD family protein [Clostridium estertheticum]MBX4271105.1 HutD family protein [Clostridium estertheticum]WLC78339.1 HutD family protein [Clostridium estertheticum]WLC89366.1 HutD family protein [Clostridium estertheticum]
MPYNIEIIKKQQYKTSKWSGGTTTEICIYPRDSLYVDRNFKWRLSSAKVEVEESIFTSLPGIARVIMIIEGEILLKHEGHYNAVLKRFEQDNFSGEWTTTSFGKVIDFNLMMAQDYNGKLESIFLNKGETKDIILYSNVNASLKCSQITEAFYVVKGDVKIVTGTKKIINLNKGDLALVTTIEKENNSEIKIYSSQEEASIIRASIFLTT